MNLVLTESIYVVQKACEIGWPVELYFLERCEVSIEDSLHAIYFRIKDVPIKSKAVGSVIHVRAHWQFPSETIHWVQLVSVVVLNDVHDSLNSPCIIVLVVLRIQVMK